MDKDALDDFEGRKDWMRQAGETSNAFDAFCKYRDFGPTRTICKVLTLHGLQKGAQGNWRKWARQNNWKERVAKYDDFNDNERLKMIEQQEKERGEAYKKMLDKMASVVDKRIDTMRPDELSAMQALDMLDKTWDLGTRVHTSQGGTSKDSKPTTGQLEISFVDTFEGL